MSRKQQLCLVHKLLNLVLGQQELTALKHQPGVQHLLRLVLCQGQQGVLGPPQRPHNHRQLEAGVVVVRGQGYHLPEAAFRIRGFSPIRIRTLTTRSVFALIYSKSTHNNRYRYLQIFKT